MNQNNVRLLKAISQLENRISRLERKQPFEVVSVATYTETQYSVIGGISLLWNKFEINQGIYFDEPSAQWTTMSAGVYVISASFFITPGIKPMQLQLWVCRDPTDPFTGDRYMQIEMTSDALSAMSGTMVVYLPENTRFYLTLNTQSTTNFTVQYRMWLSPQGTIQVFPSPLVSIVQLSAGYDPPANINDWYFEPNEIEPR